jgi:hypothetical protein
MIVTPKLSMVSTQPKDTVYNFILGATMQTLGPPSLFALGLEPPLVHELLRGGFRVWRDQQCGLILFLGQGIEVELENSSQLRSLGFQDFGWV